MKKLIPIVVTLILLGMAENAMALFQVTPSSLSFGTVPTSQVKNLSVTVTNKASSGYPNIDVTISSIYISSGSDVFKVASQDCPGELDVGKSCTVSVNFTPLDAGTHSGYLRIGTAQEGTFNVWLYGIGGGSQISFSNTSIDFGKVYVNQVLTESVQVTNNSDYTAYLTVGSSQVFQTSHNCGVLSAKSSCSINISFHPTSTGSASRTIEASWTDGSQSIYVYGTGISDDNHPDDSAGGSGGGCFIATAASGSYFNPHVKTRRDFRDKILSTNKAGRSFMEWYYRASSLIAEFIGGSAFRKAP